LGVIPSSPLAPTTLAKKLTHLESFYRQSDHSLGLGGLDDALADLNVEALCSALEAYFLSLKKAQVEELSSDFSRFDQVIQVQTVIENGLLGSPSSQVWLCTIESLGVLRATEKSTQQKASFQSSNRIAAV